MTVHIEKLETRLHAITWEAEGIHSLELRPPPGKALPGFTAGSHVDLYLPNSLVRSYSLVNPQGETGRYLLAVRRDPASRGGSRYVHERLRVGDVVTISAPRNNFALAEDAPHSVLVAGGIGITPLWCMMQRLAQIRASWELTYCARTRAHAAFREAIETLGRDAGAKVLFNFDHEPGGKMLDLAAVVAGTAPGAHLYCCGPLPMLDAFQAACSGRDPAAVHVEYFSAREAPSTEGGFTVVLERSGRSVFVPHGKTILDALLEAGIDVPFSCTEGICGTCETKVLSGTPDHRDLILTESERQAGTTMMICCSGAKSERLVLDL